MFQAPGVKMEDGESVNGLPGTSAMAASMRQVELLTNVIGYLRYFATG